MRSRQLFRERCAKQGRARGHFVTSGQCQAVIFASAASNAAAALGKSLNASPLSADCFCVSVAVGRI
jgi:hypothetical protein